MNIENLVATELRNASEQYLRDIVAHGIHNLSNNFNGSSDEEYDQFAEEFGRQAEQRLHEIEMATWESRYQ